VRGVRRVFPDWQIWIEGVKADGWAIRSLDGPYGCDNMGKQGAIFCRRKANFEWGLPAIACSVRGMRELASRLFVIITL
jgi:hypothetical protein